MTFSISEVAMAISAAVCATWAVSITIAKQPPVNLDPLYSKLDAILNLLHTTREEFMPRKECDKKCEKFDGKCEKMEEMVKDLSEKLDSKNHRRTT